MFQFLCFLVGCSCRWITMEEENVYSKDGTVDYLGNPANRKKTGTWKACPFILGNSLSLSTDIDSLRELWK